MFKTPGITIKPIAAEPYTFNLEAEDLTLEFNNCIATIALNYQYKLADKDTLSQIRQDLYDLTCFLEANDLTAPRMEVIPNGRGKFMIHLLSPDTPPKRHRKQNDS